MGIDRSSLFRDLTKDQFSKGMKRSIGLICSLIFFAVDLSPCRADQAGDPFATPAEPEQIQIATQGEEYLSNGLLKAFNEARYKNTPRSNDVPENGVIRITVLRPFASEVMLKWEPGSQGGESRLVIKQLAGDLKDPERSSGNLVERRELKLNRAKTQILRKIYTMAPIQELPLQDDGSEVLDGVVWVCEVATSDSHESIVRKNQIGDDVADEVISRKQLLRESRFASFVLMLWVIGGLEGSP